MAREDHEMAGYAKGERILGEMQADLDSEQMWQRRI